MQRVENAVSRIPNGNFIHGTAHWGARLSLDIERNAPAVGVPAYMLKAASEFWSIIPYKDLSQYPSVVDLPLGMVRPLAPNLFHATVPGKVAEIYAFQAKKDGTWGKKAKVGDPVFLDDFKYGLYSGEYRIHEVTDGSNATVSSSTPVPVVLDGKDAVAFYSRPAGDSTPVFRVDLDVDVRYIPRPDGGMGVELGDCFVSATPPISGTVSQILSDGKSFFVYSSPPHTPPEPTGGAQVALGLDWQILPFFTANIRRRLPTCLYDLTLAYTLRTGASFPLADVYLELFDETGTFLSRSRVLPIGPSNERYLVRDINASYKRYVQRFLFERDLPHYGEARLVFGNPSFAGTTFIGDVALFKGDYAAYMKSAVGSSQTFDYLERPVCDDSEIIPRGTVIAYVGGSVCPQGFTRVEGIGRSDSKLDAHLSLYSTLGGFTLLNGAGYNTRYRDGTGEPRTYIGFQVTNPRKDIHAGYTLEFRFATHSVFALISSAGQLQFADPEASPVSNKYYEIELVGDFLTVIAKATQVSGDLIIWRTGILSAAKNAPDLPSNYTSSGGSGLVGSTHKHEISQSQDIQEADDVGIPLRAGDGMELTGAKDIRRYHQHRHHGMRAASALPKVRPVLLCQKL